LLWDLGERVETPYAVPAYVGLICIPILTSPISRMAWRALAA